MANTTGDALDVAVTPGRSVTLPAGAGKTQLVSEAVRLGRDDHQHQLILTHTHAGVHAVRNRLQSLQVLSREVRVETIAGFALRLVTAYPTLAGTTTGQPVTNEEWLETYRAALRVLASPHLRRVLAESFARTYVDEYQDCTRGQHELIMALAAEVPTSVFGDPLQGIFALGKEPLVDWERDVRPSFPDLPVTNTPWRWRGHNDALGDWLGAARQALLLGEPLPLKEAPLQWRPESHQAARTCCLAACKGEETVVALRQWPSQCHELAKQLNGAYSSMEELAGKDVLKMAAQLDDAAHEATAAVLLEIAAECITRLPAIVRTARKRYAEGKRPTPKAGSSHRALYDALAPVADDRGPEAVLAAMCCIEKSHGSFVHRRECWGELKRAVRSQHAEGGSLRDAAVRMREETRRRGRRPARRVVSRTLLVKGLEYDHAVVLQAEKLDPKHLYVALTRGRKHLTVTSTTPVLTPKSRSKAAAVDK